jgi:prepilin-type N-terminal cleavage/methylation domain-containing protein
MVIIDITMKGLKAFTLMEVIIVTVVLGVIAAFVTPFYAKAVNKTLAQEVVNNLKTIATAQEAYKAGHSGSYFNSCSAIMPCCQVSEVNQELGLNIIEQKNLKYGCCNSFILYCYGELPGQWEFRINPGLTSTPACASGSCPSVI